MIKLEIIKIISVAVAKNPSNFKYASERLKNDKKFYFRTNKH
jgi:hypothetical protein